MKKLFLTALLSVSLICLLAVCISATSYKINYDGKASATTDENGQLTLRDTAVNKPNTSPFTIKDENGNDTVVTQEFFGWYTDDGRVFLPGETAIFTEDTYLRQAAGITVYNETDLKNNLGRGWWYIKLGADINATQQISTNTTGSGTTSILDLNGHNFTSSAKVAFGSGRSGLIIVGKGTVTHTGNGNFFETSQHGYGDGDQRVYIGKDVTLATNGYLFYSSNDLNKTNSLPKIKIWGKASAKGAADVTSVTNGVILFGDGADITFTGDKLVNFRSQNDNLQFIVTADNAKLTVDTSFSWYETFINYDFDFQNGQINILPPAGIITGDSVFTLNETTGYYESSIVVCPNGEHSYTEAELYGEDIFCVDGRLHYFRCSCGHYYIGSVTKDGHIFSDATTDKEATLTELGIKRVSCERCPYYYTYEFSLSPLDTVLSITVKDEDGEKEIAILAKDLFDITINETLNGFTATITAFKDFTVNEKTYTRNDIVVLAIPSGVTNITAGVISGFAALEELVIMDRANVTFVKNAVSDCPLLEKVTALDCELTFVKGGSETTSAGIFVNCPNLSVLDLTYASATFNDFAFASDTTIKHLILGSGNTYVFMTDSFRHSVLEEVIIPDNCSATLRQKCFAETETIKYVYIGRNAIASKSIGDDSSNKSIFGGNSYLEKVILIDIEYIGQWSLSTKKPGNLYQPLCDLEVYAHSENFRFHNEAFNDRAGNFTVSIYSANPNITSVTGSSKYIIYKGIGHAYELGVISPSTCVTNGLSGYVTSCPCGIDYRLNSYKTVSNRNSALNNVTHAPFGTETTELPLATEHTMSDIIMNVSFANGYLNNGTKTFKCLYCDEEAHTEDNASFSPLFNCLGYSVSEVGNGIALGFYVNEEAISEYVDITGSVLNYGVFAGAYNKIGTSEAVNANGTYNNNVIGFDLSTMNHKAFDISIVGFSSEEEKNSNIVFGAYVIESNGEKTTVSYMQGDVAPSGEKYSFVSFNSLVK